jgi:predicted Zn-dependent peptidase
MTGASLRNYMRKHYLGGDIVVALSGSFDDEEVSLLAERFSALPAGNLEAPAHAEFQPAFTVRHKPVEQNHIIIGYPGCAVADDRRFTFQLLSNILGGGMSSRLFQKLREQLGLCYSVYSYLSAQTDGGLFAFGLALTKANEPKALQAFNDEIKRFLDDGVPSDELSRAREQVKSSILLGLESTSSRMTRLGRGELTFGYVHSPDDTINGYNAVTEQDILNLAREILTPDKLALSAVGNVRSKNDYISIMK